MVVGSVMAKTGGNPKDPSGNTLFWNIKTDNRTYVIRYTNAKANDNKLWTPVESSEEAQSLYDALEAYIIKRDNQHIRFLQTVLKEEIRTLKLDELTK
jgi:hypothetical protein